MGEGTEREREEYKRESECTVYVGTVCLHAGATLSYHMSYGTAVLPLVLSWPLSRSGQWLPLIPMCLSA